MPSPIVIARAARSAKRLYPLALMAYERWQNLTPAEKERYRKMIRDNADRARRALEQRRGRGGRR